MTPGSGTEHVAWTTPPITRRAGMAEAMASVGSINVRHGVRAKQRRNAFRDGGEGGRR